jgi:hypothetical protein
MRLACSPLTNIRKPPSGGGTELADSTTNSTSTGLSKEYALSYSVYKPEPFVMMVPNMYGGSSEPIDMKLTESKAMESLQSMPQELSSRSPACVALTGVALDRLAHQVLLMLGRSSASLPCLDFLCSTTNTNGGSWPLLSLRF